MATRTEVQGGKKHKGKDDIPATNKRKCCKTMTRNDHTNLVKSIKCIEPKLLVDEVQNNIEERFTDCKLTAIVDKLLKDNGPMLEIVRCHRDYFADIHDKCKQMKNSCMQFQLEWHERCSAFLLEEKYTVAEINITENASLSAIRNTWIEFCKFCNAPVLESNPVMIEISSQLSAYLLNHVSVFQENLVEEGLSDHAKTSVSDGDDIYYHFGGVALCAMLKSRYKDIRKCQSTVRNVLSAEIFMLQSMKLEDKSCVSEYLQYRDKGFLYFPDRSLIPFLRNFDNILKEVVSDDSFRKHGDNIVKVCLLVLPLVTGNCMFHCFLFCFGCI